MNTLRAWTLALLTPLLAGLSAGVLMLVLAPAAHAQAAVSAEAADLTTRATQLALTNATAAAAGVRVSVEPGVLDPRLKLAPCDQVETYLPPGFTPWGKTRVGLRCLQGAKRWNVYLPITVKVYGRAFVAAQALPAGALLTTADLREEEIDLAAERAPAVTQPEQAVGRTLSRAVSAGESLRHSDLRARQWFSAGDTVRITAMGAGFAVQGQGQAMTAGLDGSAVRVRTESGRIVSAVAVGERHVELRL